MQWEDGEVGSHLPIRFMQIDSHRVQGSDGLLEAGNSYGKLLKVKVETEEVFLDDLTG